MKNPCKNILLFLFLIIVKQSSAQSSFLAAGKTIRSQNGVLSYSIGQFNFKSTNGNGVSQIQGMQQPYEITELSYSSNIKNKIDVVIFPNPTENNVQIIIKEDRDLKYQATLYDLSGRKIMQIDIQQNFASLSMEHLSTGTYILRINNSKKSTSFQILNK